MSVGVLTVRPAEEMPGSTGDLLPDLSQLLNRVWQAMQGVAQALWPSASMPEGLGELTEKLKWSTAALPIVEDISLPSRCLGGLGHGEDAVRKG